MRRINCVFVVKIKYFSYLCTMIIVVLAIINIALIATSTYLAMGYLKRRRIAKMLEEKRVNDFRQQEKDMLLRYKTIFNTALTDMMYYDAEGVLTNLNQKACDTFQKSRDELTNGDYTINDVLGGENWEDFEYLYSTRLPNTPDGIYYEQQVVPIRNKEHQLIGFFRTGRDVSEVVHFAHQLKASSSELAKANDNIRAYINNINYVLHEGGVRLATYSPQHHTLSIYKESDTVMLTLTQSRCMTLIDDPSKRKAMRALNNMDNLSRRPVDVHLRTLLRQKGGQDLYVHLQFHPLFNENGQVESYFGLCRDESEIVSKEQQLAKESKKAQDVEHVKNVFLRNMSYEIRTPLTSVVGFSELLEHSEDPEEDNLFIDQIKQNSTHLLHLINDILFLSRLDADMIEFKMQASDIAGLFGSFCENGWLQHKKEGVEYTVENNYHHMVVVLDATHLGQIVGQITANAAQYTKEGSVVARYDYVNNKLVVTIEDTGSGISEEDQKHLFERFTSGSEGGTGLGLPISKALTEKMGGTININSKPGRGTTVWITIPCKSIEIDRKKAL